MVLRKPNDGQILARRNCAWATVGGDLNYLDAVANLGKDVPSASAASLPAYGLL